ncbi:MAG: hypothetical protein ACLVJK_02275 [Alistipes putredinis]
MKSTLFNMVMVLFVITLLASAGVGAVHMITEEPIAEARVKATREALKQVLPEFDETGGYGGIDRRELAGDGPYGFRGRPCGGLCRRIDD